MKRLFLPAVSLLCALSLLPCSCSKADAEADPTQINDPGHIIPQRRANFVTFKASLEQDYTAKTSIDLNITRKVTWEKGDQVLIEDESGKSALYQAISGGKDTTTLTRVSGDTLLVGSTYKAWYPAYFKSGQLPSQVYYDEPDKISGAPMYAEGMAKLDFTNKCSVVRFSYNPTYNIIVKGIAFSAAEAISEDGAVDMNITEKYPSGRVLYPTTENVFPMFFLPGNYTDLNVKMYSGSEILADLTLEYVLKLGRGEIVDVDLNNLEGREVNLSKKGFANCYVLTHGGDYYFTPTKGCYNTPVEGMTDVKVLWESGNKDTAPTESFFTALTYDPDENVVRFSLPENTDYSPFNALLAGVDDSGNVLWSWHIWGCKTTIGVQQ